ncbi:MAG TPA: glycosyltransferase family 4 protein [Bacteroidia bacterium]|jgi:glycosyltransferase involved in cell wall biosynthesis
MKILQICSKVPFPPQDGGTIAMNMLTHGLIHAGNEVQVLAISTHKHFIADEEIDIDYRTKTAYRSVFIDTRVKLLDAFLNLFSSDSYNIIRFYSKAFEDALIEILSVKQFDLVQLEGLWLSPYLNTIRRYSKAKIALRSHNVEYLIWERLAENTGNPIKKIYLGLLAKRLKTYELGALNHFDAIAAITGQDAIIFQSAGCTMPIVHTPFGIELGRYKEDRSTLESPSVFHIGAMDWRPNADGIQWFLQEIWPEVLKKNEKIKLYLAGRNMPDWLKQLHQANVVIKGEVADSHAFINSHSIMIVPLNSGGGMRVKIIEGMALGKTIISTAIGAEGIEYENEKNILIANTEEEFVRAISKCVSDKAFSDTIGRNARLLAETKYNNQKICDTLSDFYRTLIKG